MALAAPTVLAQVAPSRRGIVGGIVFTGVGLGIAASGLLVPLLLRLGLTATWCGLGLLSLALTAAAWGGWPIDGAIGAVARDAPAKANVGHPPSRRALKALYVEYALNAVGLVPPMVSISSRRGNGHRLLLALSAGFRYRQTGREFGGRG